MGGGEEVNPKPRGCWRRRLGRDFVLELQSLRAVFSQQRGPDDCEAQSAPEP